MLSFRRRCLLLGTIGVCLLAGTSGAQEAAPPSVAGCVLHRHVYTCNWAEFRATLSTAHTVRVPVDPMDRFTAVQLRRLARSLGKTVSPKGQPADLEFDVISAASQGVSIGPSDQPLATLRIFDIADPGRRPRLIWAETFRGQPDRPWASQVQAAIAQFQARLSRH